jgi:hypothetical protein
MTSLLVDSTDYLWLSLLQTFAVCGSFWVVWRGFVTVKCPNNHQFSTITNDLGRKRSVASCWPGGAVGEVIGCPP